MKIRSSKVNILSWHPDGHRIATVGGESSIIIWSPQAESTNPISILMFDNWFMIIEYCYFIMNQVMFLFSED
jgi:WD40 repeat protein